MLNLKNTLDGYLKNVEVIGNTIQDENNLADIRSVGDKVEGQELYKIDVVSCGKNIFDDSNLIINNYWAGTDTHAPYPNSFLSEKFYKVKEGITYKTNVNQGSVQFMSYDKNKKFIERTNVSAFHSYTVPNNVAYLRFSVYNEVDGFKLQIEEGNQATPYEPYKENKLEILSPVQLEKVGDVADRIICKDGVWGVEKNVDTIIFNGNESWGYNTSTKVFYLSKGSYIYDGSHGCISNHFTYGETEGNYDNVIKLGNAIFVTIRKDSIANINDFKLWLQNNNVLMMFITPQPKFIPLPHDQQIKLRTFAGQTNIAFLTEIPGQIKAQVPKSLGATVNTHTEQIAELHNSLDRVKKLEETTVSTIETVSNFTTVNETSNGYFEDVKLEGRTLVNLFNFLRLDIVSQVNIYVRAQNYALTKGKEVTLVNNTDKKVIYDIYKDSAWVRSVIPSANTCMKVALKGSEYIQCCYGARADGWDADSESDKEKMKKTCIVLEGDHTQNPPEFFEGLMSVGQDVEEISVASCDFIDITEFESGGFNGEGYPVENGARVRTSNYIPYANTKLKLGMFGSQEAEIVFYNKDKTKLSNIAWVKDGDIVAVPNNTQYVRVALRYPNDVVIYPSDIKYFKMSCPKDKKPLLYYNPTTETWEKPILREWDTIEKHSDGKYYYHKRSREIVLDGSDSQSIVLQKDFLNQDVTIGFNVGRIAPDGNSNAGKADSYCDKFNCYVQNKLHTNDMEGISQGYYAIYVRIAKSKLSTQDVAGFKAWLKDNPTTVVYQLAQEEVYECTNIDLITYSGETNYIINSGAISPKSLLKVHNNISNVVKILQEKVSLLENTFIAGLKSVLSGDMYSLATILYPEDFEQNDNTEQDIMVIPE